MDRQLDLTGSIDLALQVWDWESPNPGEYPVKVGNMTSSDDNLREWRVGGKQPRVVHCPLCEEVMAPCSDGRWICLNISDHQEALSEVE